MSDVLDIIHRLTYEVNPQGLQSALSLVNSNREEIVRLQNVVKQLSADYAKTAATDIDSRKKIIDQINAHNRTIQQLNKTNDEAILNNQQLTAALQKEIGVIGLLNQQLETLRKNQKAATDPAEIAKINQQIAAAQARLQSLTAPPPPAPGSKTPNTFGALAGVNNIIRDAPFGIIGVSNNITQLTDAYAALVKETGSAGAATKVLLGSLTGPAGIAIGISLVTTLLTSLVQKYGSLDKAIQALLTSQTEEEKHQMLITKALQSSNKEFESAVGNVIELRDEIDLAKEGFLKKEEVLKHYNDTIGKTTGQVKNLDEAEQALQKNADAFIKFTLLKAAAHQAVESAAKKAFEAEMESRKSDKESAGGLATTFLKITGGGLFPSDQNQPAADTAINEAGRRNRDIAVKAANKQKEELEKIAKKFNEDAAKIAKGFNFDFFQGAEDPKKNGSEREIENAYAQKLQEMKAQLAAITASTFQADDTITAKVRAAVEKSQAEIDRLLKDKKLTSPQAATLKALASDIGDAELDKALRDYHDKIIDNQRKIDNELAKLAQEDADKHVALIVDDFDRQNAQIDQELTKQKEVYQRAMDDLLKDTEDKRKVGLLGPDPFSNDVIAAANVVRIKTAFNKLVDDLQQAADQRKGKLALSLFDTQSTIAKTSDDARLARISQKQAAETQEATTAFLDGKTTYKEYQEQLTKITNDAENKRRLIRRQELKEEIQLQKDKLKAARITATSDDERNAIQDKINQLEAQLADADAAIAKAKGDQQNQTDEKDQATLQKKISAYKSLEDAGVQAFQSILQAQQDQVNRSIDIEQTRVTRAQSIADRGNAKALQAEEQRLNQLQKQREKYARAQLAINAAQTLSQSILAVASAAGESGAGALVIVPAVIAAIAAGIGVVTSLSRDSSVGLFKGQVDLQGPGTKTSDSIPARLSRGESVITADATAKHREILEGMNAGRTYTMIDRDRIAAMTMSTVPTLPIPAAQSIAVMPAGGGMDTKGLEKRMLAVENAIKEIPATTVTLDEHGITANVQRLTHRQNLLKKL